MSLPSMPLAVLPVRYATASAEAVAAPFAEQPHLAERLHMSDGEAVWNVRHGRKADLCAAIPGHPLPTQSGGPKGCSLRDPVQTPAKF